MASREPTQIMLVLHIVGTLSIIHQFNRTNIFCVKLGCTAGSHNVCIPKLQMWITRFNTERIVFQLNLEKLCLEGTPVFMLHGAPPYLRINSTALVGTCPGASRVTGMTKPSAVPETGSRF